MASDAALGVGDDQQAGLGDRPPAIQARAVLATRSGIGQAEEALLFRLQPENVTKLTFTRIGIRRRLGGMVVRIVGPPGVPSEIACLHAVMRFACKTDESVRRVLTVRHSDNCSVGTGAAGSPVASLGCPT